MFSPYSMNFFCWTLNALLAFMVIFTSFFYVYTGYNLACIIIDLNNSVKPKSIHNRYKAWEKSCGRCGNFLWSWLSPNLNKHAALTWGHEGRTDSLGGEMPGICVVEHQTSLHHGPHFCNVAFRVYLNEVNVDICITTALILSDDCSTFDICMWLHILPGW